MSERQAAVERAAGERMAASGGEGARQTRRGPAPIASFDHDGSDESSPETKQTPRLPEIREDAGGASGDNSLAAPAARARSHSTPACGALGAPPAPRIDISRASSSSHHDSRDSSPELALFAGSAGDDAARHTLELGFREDGALDLRSSTEELAFLEPAPGEPGAAPPPPRPASTAPHAPPAPPPPAPAERRHSRKDSQSSEAALLGVSGRTSRLSSVGSQCSAQSALSAMSRISRLSVASGASRSPSPHRMLLETSFCGPKPIENDPEISAGALVEQILGMAKLCGEEPTPTPAPVDARDRREVRTEVTVESARAAPPVVVAAPEPVPAPPPPADAPKEDKENKNRSRTEERRARPRVRREPSEPEVYKSRNKSKDIIRIKLRPDDSYEEEEEESEPTAGRSKPATLEIGHAARPAEPAPAPPSPAPSRRRSPSPAAPPVSRKSSFCSLFKSRETIASPESPSEALRRKRSLTEGRSRSKSRDRSATPTSASKIRGSVLSLFRTPRRSGASPSPGSREGSPVVQAARAADAPAAPHDPRRADKLKYYDNTADGIIHIPLRTPPDEAAAPRRCSGSEQAPALPREPRPASAPQPRAPSETAPERRPDVRHDATRPASRAPTKPIHRTVLPDGSIIIPLRSPTERSPESVLPEPDRREHDDGGPRPAVGSTRIENDIGPAVVAEIAPAATIASPPREGADSRLGSTPDVLAHAEAPVAAEDARRRRKERLTFTTHVGSREQVFSTQFSITKTPSVTSEISGSFPSFGESEEARAPPPPLVAEEAGGAAGARDSSGSEPSSEAAPATPASDVERRGLVVQDSFEEELPYVPTTLPQERPVALPMVPVRERGGVRVSGTQRPRAAAPAPRHPPPAPHRAPPPPADKLRIKLPRRHRPPTTATTTGTTATPTTAAAAASAPEPHRTRSGGDSGSESQTKAEWIDFEEVPERRKQPKRIQTLPAGAVGGGVVFSYVEPEHCRCECHGHDRLPLLDDARASLLSTSSAEGGEEEACAAAAASGCPGAPEPRGGPAPH